MIIPFLLVVLVFIVIGYIVIGSSPEGQPDWPKREEAKRISWTIVLTFWLLMLIETFYYSSLDTPNNHTSGWMVLIGLGFWRLLK